MEHYRAIFALVSGLIGVIVLGYALWLALRPSGSSNRKKFFFAYIIYGSLFILASLILWKRGGELQKEPGKTFSKIEQPDISQPVRDLASIRDSVRTDSLVKPKSHPLQTSLSNPSTAQPSELVSKTSEEITNVLLEIIPETFSFEAEEKPTKEKSPLKLPTEEKIYKTINHAFNWVEKFFKKYGTDSPSSQSSPVSRLSRNVNLPEKSAISFPRVSFEQGTSNLTAESRVALSNLASKLREFPEIKILEIQAFTIDQSPEAFNFILSEARARAVKDYLILEGLEENRLIAKGFGSTVRDSNRISASRIEFVARTQ